MTVWNPSKWSERAGSKDIPEAWIGSIHNLKAVKYLQVINKGEIKVYPAMNQNPFSGKEA